MFGIVHSLSKMNPYMIVQYVHHVMYNVMSEL